MSTAKKLYAVLATVEDYIETVEGSYPVRVKNVFCGIWDTRLSAQEFIENHGDNVWMADKLFIREVEINTHDPECMGCLAD